MPLSYPEDKVLSPFTSPLEDTVISCIATEYNIIYIMPEFEDGCLILTRIIPSGFFVLTSYLTTMLTCYMHMTWPPTIMEKYIRYYILHNDTNHCLEMHRRDRPRKHCHLGLPPQMPLESIKPFLEFSFSCTPRHVPKKESIEQFFKAIYFFIKHPEEPGLWFENGHYALRNGYNATESYPHGPFKKEAKSQTCNIL